MSVKDIWRPLSTILFAAHNLESLSLLDLKVLSIPPAKLKEMLTSLPRLRELKMSAVQQSYEGVLVDAIPHLRKLHLEFGGEGANASAFLQLGSRASQSELQDVTLYHATFRMAPPLASSLPAVRTLRVSPLMIPSDLDALARVFPNVKDVAIDFRSDFSDCYVDSEFRPRRGQYHPDLPWAGYRWRDGFLNRPQKKADAWPHIDSLRVTGLCIRTHIPWTGLTCRVRRLEVGCRMIAPEQLVGVLGEHRPGAVVFHPGVFHGVLGNSRSYGWELLRALESAPCVTRLAIILCRRMENLVGHALRWSEEYMRRCSVSCLLLRLDFDYPTSSELLDQLEGWRAALSSKILSLRVLLFQIKDSVLLCWAKEEHAHAGCGWKEMSEHEGRKFIASKKMYPVSIEPCEDCQWSYPT